MFQAYPSIVCSSQGTTIKGDTFVLYTAGMDRASTYVAASRHKDNCHIFVNGEELDNSSNQRQREVSFCERTRLNKLAKSMNSNNQRSLATEIVQKHHYQQNAHNQSVYSGNF